MTATTRLGEVLRDSDGVHLKFQRTYDAPAEEVWEALTAPDRMARWIGTWSGDPASGQVEFLMSAEEGATAEMVAINECSPPTRLAVTIQSADGAWPLEVIIESADDGTSLQFVHHLAEPYDASSIGPGWQFYLDRLDASLAGGDVPDDFDEYYPALAQSYPIPPA